ncbi:plasminogen-like [Amphiura filiformis]|uniref:plasminogen-like n=1 Tax=Amphiura filiformis TaxID=82378 RepID=UPI003B211E25
MCKKKDEYKDGDLWFVDDPSPFTMQHNWNKAELDQYLNRREYCASECYYDVIGRDYLGTVHQTKDGVKCQSWAALYPHNHNKTPEKYPYDGLGEHNYCRNPDEEPNGPWCYTTDPETRWEYCPVSNCSKHASDCYYDVIGRDYRGTVNQTIDSVECQSWTAQYPHKHNKTPERYPYDGLGEHNYCRNPDKASNGPWCYTTDPGTRWEFCPVSKCRITIPCGTRLFRVVVRGKIMSIDFEGFPFRT